MLHGVWMQMAVAWLSASLGLWAASKLLDGVSIRSSMDVLWAGALLGVLQWALTGPLFVALGIGTLGIGFLLFFITRWVAAALVVMLTSKLSSRLSIDGFWSALATAFVVSLTGSAVRWLL